jgi:hypothetical protein
MKPDAEQSDSGMTNTSFEFTAYSAELHSNSFIYGSFNYTVSSSNGGLNK